MERRTFIGNVTAPVFAACAVCLAACSKSGAGTANNNNTGSSGGGNTGAVSANFTIDLSQSLLTVGSFIVQSGVIVVRLNTGNTPNAFTAVQVACTHEGTNINYNASGNDFVCPLHGSVFSIAGAVLNGPATLALKQYATTINGNIMTVTG
ncbi:MAG TPA: Rieske (2Fe-2S) protein [Sediminibacterium sp.]|nr:Rieske (2Fe-2S) protein [Sediminibacterium sp.]